MNAMPRTYILFSKMACRFLFYRHERDYLGGKLQGGERSSFVLVGGHRAASMFLQSVFTRLAEADGLPRVNLQAYFLHTDRPRVEELFSVEQCAEYFKPQGFFYGAIRRPVPLENLDRFRVLLVLRDLRDVLTSGYYSIVYAHTVIDDHHLAQKKRALEQTVDEYVLDNLAKWRASYEEMLDWAEASNIKVERYEDMVADFGGWLRRVTKRLELDGDNSLLDQIIGEADFKVAKEDVSAHKRGVVPGAHERKLKPETKEVLDRELADILGRMGYAAGVPES